MTPPMTPREKVEQAVKGAIREDASVGLQMTLTPRFMRGLVDRVLAATSVVDNEAGLVSDKLAALASSGDHAELARLAEAATRGPWVSERSVDEWGVSVIASNETGHISNPTRGQVCHVSVVAGASGDDPDLAQANAAFIAAANPATVLALLAENAALRENEKTALKECSEWARKAGEAIGKLETSEAAGIVEGWRDRATEAERKLAEAVGLLRVTLGDLDRRDVTAETANRIDHFLSKEAERG